MNANLAAADHVVGRKVTNKTKLNYRSKIKILKSFLSTKEEYRLHLTEDEDFNLPLPEDGVKEFFGWLSTNSELPKRKLGSSTTTEVITIPEESSATDIAAEPVEDTFAENEVTISHSCMAGYKSALVWLYSEKRLKLGAELNSYIDDFIKGYKKQVAEKKHRGVMKINEGKSILPFEGEIIVIELSRNNL